MAEAKKETYFLQSTAQVLHYLRQLGAVNVPGSRTEYSARGGKRVVVKATRGGFDLTVIPPNCVC